MDRKTLDQGLEALTRDLGAIAGLNASVLLYGSAARTDWVPGRSDVNLLVLIDDATPTGLLRLTPAVTAWHNRGFVPPLIMSHAEWERSVDVFPIEITDMQLSHRTLCGDDPVQGMAVDPGDLREAVEKELRGKLVRLRQAYVRFGDSGSVLGRFALASVPTLFALLRCIAVLQGRTIGTDAASAVTGLGAEFQAGGRAALDVMAHRAEQEWNCSPETFVQYMDFVCRLVELVDVFQPGVR